MNFNVFVSIIDQNLKYQYFGRKIYKSKGLFIITILADILSYLLKHNFKEESFLNKMHTFANIKILGFSSFAQTF